VNYNTSAVKIYNRISSLVRLEKKLSNIYALAYYNVIVRILVLAVLSILLKISFRETPKYCNKLHFAERSRSILHKFNAQETPSFITIICLPRHQRMMN
jgi:hypothetical protein